METINVYDTDRFLEIMPRLEYCIPIKVVVRGKVECEKRIFVHDGHQIIIENGGALILNAKKGTGGSSIECRLVVKSGGKLIIDSCVELDGDHCSFLKGARLHINAHVLVYRNVIFISDDAEVLVGRKMIASGRKAKHRLFDVARCGLENDDSLCMAYVHGPSFSDNDTCNTTHCIAGWAIYLYAWATNLEKDFGFFAAGLYLLGAKAARHFFDDDDKARAFLERALKAGE